MPEKPYITIEAADEKVHFVADQLTEALSEFNDQHPDPDAAEVAENLDLPDDYIIQLCALTLAETHIVGPETQEGSKGGRLRSRLRDSFKSRETRSNRDEVETG